MSMDKESRKLYEDVLRAWGSEDQLWMAVEEIGELLTSLNKLRRGASVKDVITELADVSNMVEQLAVMFGVEDYENEKLRKLSRLRCRLDKWNIEHGFSHETPWQRYDHTKMEIGHRYAVRKRMKPENEVKEGELAVKEFEFFIFDDSDLKPYREDMGDTLFDEFCEIKDYDWKPFRLEDVKIGRRYMFRRPQRKPFLHDTMLGREEACLVSELVYGIMQREYDEHRTDFTEMADITDDPLWNNWLPLSNIRIPDTEL